jgi:hypothetical protein
MKGTIPRYRPNPVWFWWRFCFWDDPNGKFCEYRDYEALKEDYQNYIKGMTKYTQELQQENTRLSVLLSRQARGKDKSSTQ